tara:strand:+ start:1085 stop:3802 length:2718 start_codon:yes stop_codon:yes gene_type:complete
MNEINIIKYYYLREIIYFIITNQSTLNLHSKDIKEFNKLFEKIKQYINENNESFCDLFMNNLINERAIYNKVIDVQGNIIKNIKKYQFFSFLDESLTDITKKVLDELYDIKNKYNFGLVNIPIILPDTFNKNENNFEFLNNDTNDYSLEDGDYVLLSNDDEGNNTQDNGSNLQPLSPDDKGKRKSSFFGSFFGISKNSESSKKTIPKFTTEQQKLSKKINDLSQDVKFLSFKETHIDIVNESSDKKINLDDINRKIKDILLRLRYLSKNPDVPTDIDSIEVEIEKTKTSINTAKSLKQKQNLEEETKNADGDFNNTLLKLDLENIEYDLNICRQLQEGKKWETALENINKVLEIMSKEKKFTKEIPIMENIKNNVEEISTIKPMIETEKAQLAKIEKEGTEKEVLEKKLQLETLNKRLIYSLKKEEQTTRKHLKTIQRSLNKNIEQKNKKDIEKSIQKLEDIKKTIETPTSETPTSEINKESEIEGKIKEMESTIGNLDSTTSKLFEDLKNDLRKSDNKSRESSNSIAEQLSKFKENQQNTIDMITALQTSSSATDNKRPMSDETARQLERIKSDLNTALVDIKLQTTTNNKNGELKKLLNEQLSKFKKDQDKSIQQLTALQSTSNVGKLEKIKSDLNTKLNKTIAELKDRSNFSETKKSSNKVEKVERLKLHLEELIKISNKEQKNNLEEFSKKQEALLTSIKAQSLNSTITANTAGKIAANTGKQFALPKEVKDITEDTKKLTKVIQELVDNMSSSTQIQPSNNLSYKSTENENYKDLLAKIERLNEKINHIDVKKNKKEYKKDIDESDTLIKSIIDKLNEVDEIKKISEKNEELDLLLGELSNFTRNIQSAVERNCELVENLEEKTRIKLENKNTDFTIKLPKDNIEIQRDDIFKNFFEGHK